MWEREIRGYILKHVDWECLFEKKKQQKTKTKQNQNKNVIHWTLTIDKDLHFLGKHFISI